MKLDDVLLKLKAEANPEAVHGMVRFGISGGNVLGISIPFLRKLAKEIKTDHELAIGLWQSGIHEARILASMVANAAHTDDQLMEQWVKDFDSWDVTDQVCMNLFRYSPLAFEKAIVWSSRTREFEKRAGFALMASLAHVKKYEDDAFLQFFPLIEKEAIDERNFVKKAVNWALRQIGKRSPRLKDVALISANKIKQSDSKSARWVASDAIRELAKR